jgi:hypothetical protein
MVVTLLLLMVTTPLPVTALALIVTRVAAGRKSTWREKTVNDCLADQLANLFVKSGCRLVFRHIAFSPLTESFRFGFLTLLCNRRNSACKLQCISRGKLNA